MLSGVVVFVPLLSAIGIAHFGMCNIALVARIEFCRTQILHLQPAMKEQKHHKPYLYNALMAKIAVVLVVA